MIGLVKGSGHLSPELIRAVVRENYAKFRSCYERGLERNSTLEGGTIYRFEIGVDGRVASAAVVNNRLPNCAVVHCIRDSLRELMFPHPNGGAVTVFYPIQLLPGSAPASGAPSL
jgi:hypothetical protein